MVASRLRIHLRIGDYTSAIRLHDFLRSTVPVSRSTDVGDYPQCADTATQLMQFTSVGVVAARTRTSWPWHEQNPVCRERA
jgi:hypothetical protein